MSVFTPIEGSYSNHIGGAFTHPVTGAVYFLVTWRQNSTGPYRLQVWEDAPPYGDPRLIREWITGTEAAGPGPWGYGTCTWMPDGSLYVMAPGGVDGSQVKPAIHIEPNVFPPITFDGPPGPPGAGLTLFSAPQSVPAWNGRALIGSVLVDIPTVFGVPSAPAYLLRFAAQATAADVRVRAGSEQAPYFLTLNTQLPDVQVHTQGWAPGPQTWISTVNGSALVWLQICGMSG